MLLNGGEIDGHRILSPRGVQLLTAAHIPSTLPGRVPGEGYGLGVRVVVDATARASWLSNGSYGWQGADGTCFFVDPSQQVVAIAMTQTIAACANAGLLRDLEQVVGQAIVGD
jgi:CubicO group peptidase (beta-lactamase class C family)